MELASIYDIKPQFQNLLRPIVNQLAKVGITPNQVTVSAMLLSVGTGIILLFFYENPYILALIPIVMFVRMALNAIEDRKSTRLNSSHVSSSYAVFCLKKKTTATVVAGTAGSR